MKYISGLLKNVYVESVKFIRKEFYNIYKNKESDIFKKAKQELQEIVNNLDVITKFLIKFRQDYYK